LRYFHLAVSEPSRGLPQFVSVGCMDGTPITRYDSERRRMEPQVQWMKANLDQQYWDGQTQLGHSNQEIALLSLGRV
ncbi:HA1F protein, partial [Indicator maculatus]|nr:HA1F protein [Indicator maculatus]